MVTRREFVGAAAVSALVDFTAFAGGHGRIKLGNVTLALSQEQTKIKAFFAALAMVFSLLLAGCGGGGGSVAASQPDTQAPPPSIGEPQPQPDPQPQPQPDPQPQPQPDPQPQPQPDPQPQPQPDPGSCSQGEEINTEGDCQALHDFSTCHFQVRGLGCAGGAPGFYELREYVRRLFSSGQRTEDQKVTLLASGGTQPHVNLIYNTATLHLDGVGGDVSSHRYLNNGLVSNAVRDGIITQDIIFWSASGCIDYRFSGRNCFYIEQFNEDDDPIVFISAGNNGNSVIADDIHPVVINTPEKEQAVKDGIATGHFMWVYGLDGTHQEIHPSSSSCGELVKDYCIGAYFNVKTSDSSFSAGTSLSAPIVASAAKLLMEADPSLKGTEAIKLICITAYDLGETGNDAKYGCGALNLVALFNKFGEYIGSATIPGIRSSSSYFAISSTRANMEYVAGSFGQEKVNSFYLARNKEAVATCYSQFCFFTTNLSGAREEQGVSFGKGNSYLNLSVESSDSFFGGSSIAKSSTGRSKYTKLSVGNEFEIDSTTTGSLNLGLSKGKADGGERIESLKGFHKEISLGLEKRVSPGTSISFSLSRSLFDGEATIYGNSHRLNDGDSEVYLQLNYTF